jgi:aminopeptidase N
MSASTESRRRGLRRGGLTAVTGATCAMILVAGTASAAGTPGGQSIGDPYYPTDGNTGYDVRHYDLRLSYTPGADKLSGTATILATAGQDLSRFSLDFGLNASSVLVNSRPASFTKKASKLVVTPKRALPTGTPFTVVVRYSGVPSTVEINGEKGWVATPKGAIAANEPHSAAFWYPVNDHPLDKATYDVSVSVPKGPEVISSGDFLGASPEPTGRIRWNWRSATKQAPYLNLLAIGDYQHNHTSTPAGMPFNTAYDTNLGQLAGAAKSSVQRTPEINKFLLGKFGPYPFEAQGGTVTKDIGYALETQANPVYSDKFFATGSNTYVVAHENAHQWFGDAVSVHNWRDIWCNEGFASYAEWLWSNHIGEGTEQQNFDFLYNQVPADDPFWQVLPGDPGPANQFSGAVYDRGAMTLQALRNLVGDQAFFATLKAWVKGRKEGNGSVGDFIALAEKTSGKQLDALFRTWLFTAGKPLATRVNGFPPGSARNLESGKVAKPRSFDKIAGTHELLAHEHG